jgi:hypothetical protein
MLIRACACLVLISVVPLWAQDADSVQRTAVGADANGVATEPPPDTNHGMVTPPPVSDVGLPLNVAAETDRRNYIRGGVSFQTAYDTGMVTASTTPAGINSSILSLLDVPGFN